MRKTGTKQQAVRGQPEEEISATKERTELKTIPYEILALLTIRIFFNTISTQTGRASYESLSRSERTTVVGKIVLTLRVRFGAAWTR
jgi:hypothetical protein